MKIEGIVAALRGLETALDAAGASTKITIAVDQPKWAEFVRAASAYLDSPGGSGARTSDSIRIKDVVFYCWKEGADPLQRDIRRLQDISKHMTGFKRIMRASRA